MVCRSGDASLFAVKPGTSHFLVRAEANTRERSKELFVQIRS
jgi:hypothetical protein